MFPEVKMYTFNLVLSFHFNLIFFNFICCEKAVIYNMSQTVLCQQLEICCQPKRAITLWTVFCVQLSWSCWRLAVYFMWHH